MNARYLPGKEGPSALEKAFELLDEQGLHPTWKKDRSLIEFKSPLNPHKAKATAYAQVNADGVVRFGDHASKTDAGQTHQDICERIGYAGKAPRNTRTVELVDEGYVPPSLGEAGAKRIATHRYWNLNRQGEPVYLGDVVRFQVSDGQEESHKEPRLRRPIDGKWAWTWDAMKTPAGMYYPRVPRVLYGLPEVVNADDVIITEGEKCADRLRAEGRIATTNPGGAGKWGEMLDHAREVLAGKRVIVAADNDKKGIDHARKVARSLVGYAASVVLLPPFAGDEGYDVYDWLEDGHTMAEFDALVAATPPLEPPDDDTPATLDNHRGNAELLVHLTGEKWIHVHEVGHDYLYQPPRWAEDRCDRTRLIASDALTAAIFAQAQKHRDVLDEKRAKQLDAQALAMGDKRVIDNVLAFARSMVAKSPNDLDADPWLLNVANGTIDLRTGSLRPHAAADFITKLAPVEWREGAECPTWLRCLDRWFQGDAGLIRHLQQLAGCSLTGVIRDQYLWMFYGAGGNGKNVLLDTWCGILGDYAGESAPGLLEATKHDRHPTEIMDLKGKRLVVTSETESNTALRVQFTKRLTGNQTLKGRFMRGDFIEFARTNKTILVTNNKPRIPEDTEGVWRRILLIPFNVVIPAEERDARLTEKLREEWPGILAWMVAGCLDWQQNGFVIPDAIRAATAEYRKDENPVGMFIEACCELGEPFKVRATDLWQTYDLWRRSSGYPAMSSRKFAETLKHTANVEKKTVDIEGRKSEGWRGIHVRPDAPKPRF